MRPWKTPCALPVTMLRITSVEVVCGAIWSSIMVTSVCVSPDSRLTPRSVKSLPSPVAVTRISWRTSLPPAFMTNSVSLAFLPSSALNWPKCVALSGWSWTIIQTISASSPSSRWLTELTSAAPLPVCRSTIVALAPLPTRTGKRTCVWPPACTFCSSIGSSSTAPAAMSTKKPSATKAALSAPIASSAPRSSSAGAKLPSCSFSASRCTVDAVDRQRALGRATPFSTGSTVEPSSSAATGLAFVVRVMRRHAGQQAPEIGVVPGFDAPGRQAGLEHLDGVVALHHHRGVARQQRKPLAERVDQRRFGGRSLWACRHVHDS